MTVAPSSIPLAEDRHLCGWRVASALPLPDLAPWRGDARAPDLVVELGPVPARLDRPVVETPLLQVAADGTCRFEAEAVAAYLVDPRGRRVVIDPLLPPEAPEVRVFLFGTVVAILCFQRGLLPLHASCVRVGDRAVAFAGASGLGKSTLAGALLARGHSLLADDVTVLDLAAPGGPVVLPAFPRLKLWRDAAARLAIPVDGLERSRVALDKFHVPVSDAFCADQLPLAAVFHLQAAALPDGAPIRRLRGAEAAAAVARDVYRGRMMRALGHGGRMLPATVAVAGVAGGTFAVAHGHGPGGLERSVAAILDQLGA